MPKMISRGCDEATALSEWCDSRQRKLVATIVAEAIALIDRIVEDKYYDAWIDHEARMLDDISPLDMLRADAIEKQLLARIAQERSPNGNADPDLDTAGPARRRKRRRPGDRGPPMASWNTSAPGADQTAVGSPSSSPAMGGAISEGASRRLV